MKKKNREHSESLESNKKKCMQSVEVCPHSPLLFEDQSSQDIYVHKKKSKKKKIKQEKQDSWLDSSCIGGTCEVNNETVTDASKKKMKKKKRKHSDSEQEQNNALCIHVNQEMDTTLERVDYTYVNASAKKKKRKKNLSEEQDEVNKLPGLYAFGNDCRSQKKKKENSPAPVRHKKPVMKPLHHRLCHIQDKILRPLKKGMMSYIILLFTRLPESVVSDTEEHQDVGFTEFENSTMLNNEEFLESSMCSAMDLETVKRKLEEFIPQVWTLSETSILKMAGRDLIRFKKFKEQGMPIKFGRFSQKENTQIQKNVEDFLSLTEIENAEKLLFTYRYPEEQQAITKLKTKYAFGMKIAEGIPRPWKQVYFRARKMFDPNNYKGRYSEDEKEKLKKFYAIHGNNWKKISEMMSRSTHSVAMKYSQIKSQVNSGPWSKEETQKLVQAVKETIQKRADLEDIQFLLQAQNSDGTLSVEREQLYKNISWTEIEAKVGTRYWRQCKQKWISIVTKKMSNGQNVYGGTKGLQAKINLIKRLYEMKVEDANEVNWEELCEIIG
uniref:Transcription termination factor 1 n=1 Tax=Chrysemys picta bellii TaxID=8478 RepID=A0A8C3I8P5_CHRPI